MKKLNCRICGHKLLKESLLHYANMPKGAQNLPDKAGLKNDIGVSLDIFQCSGCGLIQLINEPVPYYKDVIRAAAFSADMKAFRLKQFKEFVDKYSLKGKPVVEIGCGRGEYLSLMKQCGVAAYGLENLQTSVDDGLKNGLNMSAGFIERDDQLIAGGPFAAFFIMNYLEHLPDPNLIFSGISNNLAPEGVGLIEVPNFDMILRKKLFSEFIPDHLFYFTSATLKTALNLNGFEVLECNEIWRDYIISMVVRKRARLDISSFSEHQTRLKSEIEGFIGRYGNMKVAIWGAGHQALAIMALTKLAGKIKYVVDSAPFKQGKYTPVSHIPIVSPQHLNSDPVDAILIMAGGYSDEVVRIVNSKFVKKADIAVLRETGLEILS